MKREQVGRWALAAAFVAAATMTMTASGMAGPPVTKYGMRDTLADRPGDVSLSDAATSGTNVYTDGVDSVISKITDKTSDPDAFSLQAFGPRHLRLVIPGVVDTTCGYGADRFGSAQPDGEIYGMAVGSVKTAEALLECYESANRLNGWKVDVDPCTTIEHPTATRWQFRADIGCTGHVYQVVKRKVTSRGIHGVAFQIDAEQL